MKTIENKITLDQYLSSKSEAMPYVELQVGEFRRGVKVEGLTQIFINIWSKTMYVVKDGDNRLYVPDNYGYAGKGSCFYIQENNY